MPVFLDNANSSRDLRILPTFATPLPRLSTPPKASNDGQDPTEKYDIVVVGVCLSLREIRITTTVTETV